MERTYEFEFEVDPILVELDLEYSYYRQPAKLNGSPEDCYPEEEEGEVSLVGNWKDKIRDAFMAEAEQAIRSMEDRLMDLEFDNMPRKWAQEDQEYWRDSA